MGVLGTLLPAGTLLWGFLNRSLIELRARPHVATKVLGKLHDDGGRPVQEHDLEAARKLLDEICLCCTPRSPEGLPNGTPYPVSVAFRFYAGEILNLLLMCAVFWAAMLFIFGIAAAIPATLGEKAQRAWFGALLACQAAFWILFWLFPAAFHGLALLDDAWTLLFLFLGCLVAVRVVIAVRFGRRAPL